MVSGPVIAALTREGIEISAVPNHLGGESPRISYVHFHVRGGAARIARMLDAALRLTSVPRPVAQVAPRPLAIDTGLVFTAMDKRGKGAGAMAQLSYARPAVHE